MILLCMSLVPQEKIHPPVDNTAKPEFKMNQSYMSHKNFKSLMTTYEEILPNFPGTNSE